MNESIEFRFPGDVSVAEAAKRLTKAGIAIGQRHLFIELEKLRWIYRDQDDAWHARREYILTGLLEHRSRSYQHPYRYEVIQASPQVRVTARGLTLLAEQLVTSGVLEVLV